MIPFLNVMFALPERWKSRRKRWKILRL